MAAAHQARGMHILPQEALWHGGNLVAPGIRSPRTHQQRARDLKHAMARGNIRASMRARAHR
eukprot:1964880-Pyramimonas_sp.AAC.1